MSATLISAIGRGQRDIGTGTYDRVRYTVAGVLQPPTPFFVSAWLNAAPGADIDQVHIIGTATSSWSALVEEYRAEDLQLWEHLESLCGTQDAPGVSNADLEPLAAILGTHWRRQVTCHVLCHQQIDDSVSDAIIAHLLGLFPLHEPQRNLVIDMTHALRTLPLLALSAVQIGDAIRPGLSARTRIIYGERLVKNGDGRGVSLDGVLTQQRFAYALRRFLDSYDGEKLAELLQSAHEELASAIKNLGVALLCMDIPNLPLMVQQLLTALDKPPKTAIPGWEAIRGTIRNKMQPLHEHKHNLPCMLLALADLHIDRRQYALALLVLSEATSTLACPQPVDNKDAYQAAIYDYARALPKDLREDWEYIRDRRNAVAHAANRSDAGRVRAQSAAKVVQRARQSLLNLICHHAKLTGGALSKGGRTDPCST